jgi:hypothetical protein
MALTIGDLSAVTRELVLPGVVDAAIENEPMWDWMLQNGNMTAEGGDEIRRVILYDRNSTQWHTKRDQLSTNDTDKRTHARYPWRYASHPINLAEADIRNNEGSGAHQIASLLETERQAANEGFSEALGKSLFSDGSQPSGVSTGRQMDGFKSYIGTGTYADINPSDLTDSNDWKATSLQVSNSGTGKLVKSDIQKRILTDINKDFTNQNADLAVCNMAVWSKIWELIEPQQRLLDGDNEPGFSSFSWNGEVEFVVDDRAPGSGRGTSDNKIYFFRSDDLEITRHEDVGMSMSDFKSPIDQDVLISFVQFQGNFTPAHRKFAGELTGIDPSA